MKQQLLLIFGGLIFCIALAFLFYTIGKNKTDKAIVQKTRYHLFEVNQGEISNSTSITGLIRPKVITQIIMQTSGVIDEDNRSLSVGESIKKNEILIKLERLKLLYQLLKDRTDFKFQLQNVLSQIEQKLPDDAQKWATFEKNVHSDSPLPDLPNFSNQEEKEFINKVGIISKYYTIKKIKQNIEAHFYVAPFDGTIIKSSVAPGVFVKKGKPILTIAKNDKYIVSAIIPLQLLNDFKASKRIYFVKFVKNKADTIGYGKFINVQSKLSDSSTIEIACSIDKLDKKPQMTNVKLLLPLKYNLKKTGVVLPKSAVLRDSVQLFLANKIFSLPINVINENSDSVFVTGLPHHCFVITNP